MKKYIYTIAIDVIAEDQDEATVKVYNTILEELNTHCLTIEEEDF